MRIWTILIGLAALIWCATAIAASPSPQPLPTFPIIAVWEQGETIISWDPPAQSAQVCLNREEPAVHIGCTSLTMWKQSGGDIRRQLPPGTRIRAVAYDENTTPIGIVLVDVVAIQPVLWLPSIVFQ